MCPSAAPLALVAGGAGQLGEGITRAFLRDEWRVVVPLLDPAEGELLVKRLPPELRAGLYLIEADLSTESGARAALEETRRRGRLERAVACLGHWREDPPLVELSPDAWSDRLATLLIPHFLCARSFLPELSGAEGASYTFVNGGTAERPQAGAGTTCIAAAAQLMLMRQLAAEAGERDARVQALAIQGPVRSRRGGRPEWLGAEEVGELLLRFSGPEGARWHGRVLRVGSPEELEGLCLDGPSSSNPR